MGFPRLITPEIVDWVHLPSSLLMHESAYKGHDAHSWVQVKVMKLAMLLHENVHARGATNSYGGMEQGEGDGGRHNPQTHGVVNAQT